jgi:hypothetical protein
MNKILLIPEKSDAERESVLLAWVKKGGKGKKVDRFWEKPSPFTNQKVAIYGNDTFALVLAQILGVTLISPDDSMIARLDKNFVKRNIQQKRINELSENDFPVFIKPVIPKQFAAKIYHSADELKQETRGLNEEEMILLSEIIQIEAEARAFILKNELMDIAVYHGKANVEEGKLFLTDFLKTTTEKNPVTYVIDIGYNSELGWFVIEFNSSWGAGLNNCNPDKVIDCIYEATV